MESVYTVHPLHKCVRATDEEEGKASEEVILTAIPSPDLRERAKAR